MESEIRCYGGSSISPVADAVNLIVQQAFFASKSIHWLLFLIESVNTNADAISNLLEAEKRFPFNDLKKVTTHDAECKDDSETEDNSDDDDDDDDDEGAGGGDDSDNDAEDSSGDESNDNEQGDADSDSDENAEEDDDEDDDDDDSDEDDDDDEDDEDEEEDNQPPFKKKK